MPAEQEELEHKKYGAIKPNKTSQMGETFSSTGLLGNDLSDIMATLCLIHWLRYLIMFWYSTHLMSMSCGGGKKISAEMKADSKRTQR